MEKDFRLFMKKWANAQINPITANELLRELRAILRGTLQLTEDRKKTQKYFRVRAGEVEDDTDPTQFSYPPVKYTSQGRCNLEGYPVFYGSEAPHIAIAETGIGLGVDFYLGLWTSDDNHPKYAEYIWQDTPKTERLLMHRKMRIDEWKSMGEKNLEIISFVMEKMTRMFIADTHSISAAISHENLYAKGIDGIEYLDAKTQTCYNFALRPAFADKLRLEKIYHMLDKDHETYIMYKVGEVKEGRIIWRQFEDKDAIENLPGMKPHLRSKKSH